MQPISGTRSRASTADGNGLTLVVTPSGGRAQVLVITAHGKRRVIGLGD